ncbi:hypothetical protein THIOM_005245 [Candidatus Thiomargarita nelsonii]|uniref:Uncharacterized protein n=1 Tax=Candidatus Thiomargarita nelsonii TaxID=1003181 RepID=A0A176RTU7_9GAMM|nr:hypothetical protein THIOM_005245 [Candidatus Thiomargarita nelsonii]
MSQYHQETLGITARVLTPFYYHGLYARDGSATHPNVITDTAFMFALRATLLGTPPVLRAKPDYKADLKNLPWRASLLMGTTNSMLPPVRHTIDVAREGGYHENMQKNMGSGNFKGTFFVHEVAVGASYEGILLGPDPFKILKSKRFIMRVGVAKQGMLEISPHKSVKTVRLNTATAKLFGRDLKEAYRIIDTIRVSQALSQNEATEELRLWY